ncbi:MAG: UDP-N-acetylmuramate dehydrogenase [Lachnospiraceae bacterium]|nr:UDP-N-acetylmuramate dehydrogenase [Lachnospiraceae bacterium]
MNFYEQLQQILKPEQIFKEEPMKNHTTFRIGGPADWFVTPSTKEEIHKLVDLAASELLPVSFIGNGSNLLVGDLGIRGLVIQIGRGFSKIELEGEILYAEAGASLARIAGQAYEAGLTGFEFAAGIPGTLGGAVTMNAGAYGGEMKDVLTEVEVLTPSGERKVLPADRLNLSYRYSIIPEEGWIVLGARIRLSKGDKVDIKAKMEEYSLARRTKQPLEFPSAGSTFKRPEGFFAGKLIQDSGLKGASVGDAKVSTKHSGFVINEGQASARDVQSLIYQVQQKVYEDSGENKIMLNPEVKMIGEFLPLEPMEPMILARKVRIEE